MRRPLTAAGHANPITRRDFIGAVAAAGAALGTLASAGARSASEHTVAKTTAAAARPVLSFHLDQPYIDYSGTAQPYQPPRGARAGAPLEHLDEAALRCLGCFT